MARHHTKLARKEVERIFFQLCLAMARTRKIGVSSKLLRDLLSYQEAEMIAKRLKIAELILAGNTYDEIREMLKVSPGTIARVQEWLKISGDGYRWAVQKTKGGVKKFRQSLPTEKFSDWSQVKKRYPMYFWPELLLEEIVRSATRRQKERLRKVVEEMKKMKQKRDLYQKLNRLLRKKSV